MTSASVLSRVKEMVRFVALVLVSTSAYADFSGPYDPSQWFINDSFGGTAEWDTFGQSLLVTGPEISNPEYTYIELYVQVPMAHDGWAWSFDWHYTDQFPSDNFPAYIQESELFPLPINTIPPSFGHVQTTVTGGDSIGFTIDSPSAMGGPGFLTISNFSVMPVPEPASALVLGGIASLAMLRRRKPRGVLPA